MKCNQSHPGFELVLPCPFPMTITTGTSKDRLWHQITHECWYSIEQKKPNISTSLSFPFSGIPSLYPLSLSLSLSLSLYIYILRERVRERERERDYISEFEERYWNKDRVLITLFNSVTIEESNSLPSFSMGDELVKQCSTVDVPFYYDIY